MLKKLGLLVVLFSSPLWAQDKAIIGQSANMLVAQTQLHYEARIDTGAVNTSLHAFDIEVEGGSAKR